MYEISKVKRINDVLQVKRINDVLSLDLSKKKWYYGT